MSKQWKESFTSTSQGSVQIFPGSRRQLTGSRKLHRPFAQAVRDSRWCARPNEGFVQQLWILEQQQGKKAACPVMGCKTCDVASTATVTTSQLQHSKFRYVIVLHPCLISVFCKYQQAILAGSLASSGTRGHRYRQCQSALTLPKLNHRAKNLFKQ